MKVLSAIKVIKIQETKGQKWENLREKILGFQSLSEPMPFLDISGPPTGLFPKSSVESTNVPSLSRVIWLH